MGSYRKMKKEIELTKRQKAISMKIAKITMWVVIPLLLSAIVLIVYEIITKGIEGIIRLTIIITFLIYMIIFAFHLILLLTKYKKEFELDEGYIPYQKFFTFSLFIILFSFGLSEIIIYKNWNSFYLIFIGILLIINQYKLNKKEKIEKIRQRKRNKMKDKKAVKEFKTFIKKR